MSGNADAFTIYLLGLGKSLNLLVCFLHSDALSDVIFELFLAYKAVGDLEKAKQTFIQVIKLYSYLWERDFTNYLCGPLYDC